MSGRVKRFWSGVLVLAAGAALIQIDGVVASGLGAAALYVGAGVVVMPPRFRISTRRAVAIALGLLGAIAIGVLVPTSFSVPTPEMTPLNAVVGTLMMLIAGALVVRWWWRRMEPLRRR